jgi:hypothetical protein
MQKKLPIIVGVLLLLLVLVGGGMFLLSNKSATPGTQTQTNQNSPKSEGKIETTSVSGTIKDLLAGGKTQTCTITYPNNAGTGTIYLADKKMSGNFTIREFNGKQITGNMVSDGTYMYTWSTDANMGIKMNLAETQKQVQSTTNGQNSSVDINQKVDMKCSSWNVDNSKFTVPTNIKFTDMTNLLKQLPSQKTTAETPAAGATNGSEGSSPCDQIPDATAKAACVKALQGIGN